MTKRRRNEKASGGAGTTKRKAAETEAPVEKGECRCKEMSKKTPRELLRVAADDLSFWKKKK